MVTEKEALQQQFHAARNSASTLAQAETARKDAALCTLADLLIAAEAEIIAANQQDIQAAENNGYAPNLIDRLRLDTRESIAALAQSVRAVAALPDPVGVVIAQWQQPSGLDISRVRKPLGVIGVIYESRPNVTVDAGILCFKSGNAVILRGGKEAMQTNRALCGLFQQALEQEGFDPALVQLVQSPDRALVGEMLQAQEFIDVIVPRGGKSLVSRVMSEARVPVFAHLEGIVHLYIHGSAEPDLVQSVVLNAKMRRTSICGAAECLLIDQAFATEHIQKLFTDLIDAGCTLRGDAACCALDQRVQAAVKEDWGCEYLDSILAVKMVQDQAEAESHIARYSSGHTEVILSTDTEAAEGFLNRVDSAIVMHNASSQFADGGEFGMGAEIGISTGRMHARGPIGLEQLTTFHYQVRGHGEIRS